MGDEEAGGGSFESAIPSAATRRLLWGLICGKQFHSPRLSAAATCVIVSVTLLTLRRTSVHQSANHI
jgi:hypothetical protein